MKYWLLTTEFPPFFGGGISTYCYHTAKMLCRYGHEVTVFVPSQDIEQQIIVEEKEGVRIVRFRPGSESYYQFLGWIAALSFQFSEIVDRFIEQEGPPDVIESQDYLGIAYFTLQKKYTFCGKATKVPVIITAHTPKFICDRYDRKNIYRLPDFWIGEMERFCYRAADAVISPSLYLVRELSGYLNFNNTVLEVIRNPFEAENTVAAQDVQPEDKDKRIIIFGRLQPLKGILHILKYLQGMWDEGFSFRVEIIGGDWFSETDGQMMSEYLKKKYRKYFDCGMITWHGSVHPKALLGTLSQAYLGIVPSLFENFPYTVVELMHYGVLTLASDSGGQAEIIEDGESGFLFSHSVKGSFAEKFLTAINLDCRDRARIIENAYHRIRQMCAYETVYAKKMELINRIMGKESLRRTFPFIRSGADGGSWSDNSAQGLDGEEEPGLLSVVIPYYNMGQTLRETVESIFVSGYTPKEVIIINDGSDDPKSIAALYRIAREYPVRIIHKKNEGLASARNDGARHARGEFLAFLDADDLVEPDYYELAINILRAYRNVSFVGCWIQYFGASQGIWPTWNSEPPFLLVHNTINSSGLVFRRKDFLSLGLNDPEMVYGLEDYECVIRMVRKGCGGVAIPRPLHKYRVRPVSMFRQIDRERMVYLYRLLVEKNKDIYEKYSLEVINLLNSNGPGYLYDNPTFQR